MTSDSVSPGLAWGTTRSGGTTRPMALTRSAPRGIAPDHRGAPLSFVGRGVLFRGDRLLYRIRQWYIQSHSPLNSAVPLSSRSAEVYGHTGARHCRRPRNQGAPPCRRLACPPDGDRRNAGGRRDPPRQSSCAAPGRGPDPDPWPRSLRRTTRLAHGRSRRGMARSTGRLTTEGRSRHAAWAPRSHAGHCYCWFTPAFDLSPRVEAPPRDPRRADAAAPRYSRCSPRR
jgi:hypothetical protein